MKQNKINQCKSNTWYCHLLLFIHFVFHSNSDPGNFYMKHKPGPVGVRFDIYFLCLLLLIKGTVEMGLISEAEYKKRDLVLVLEQCFYH